MHINDKTFLKGVGFGVGVRAQTTVAATGVTRTQPATLNRIGTTLPPVVSIHPATVLVQSPPMPLKTQPSHTSKVNEYLLISSRNKQEAIILLSVDFLIFIFCT